MVREKGEISFGIRDPRQIVSFFEAALQALEPQDFGDYETGKRAISQQLGVDVDEDIFGSDRRHVADPARTARSARCGGGAPAAFAERGRGRRA